MSDSLTAIYVEPHQCPSHQPILLTQGPICESFAKIFWELAILKNVVFLSRPFWILFFKKKKIFFCFFLIKTSQSLLVSKDGSKFWSSQMWQHFLTQTKHFDRECNCSMDSLWWNPYIYVPIYLVSWRCESFPSLWRLWFTGNPSIHDDIFSNRPISSGQAQNADLLRPGNGNAQTAKVVCR